MVRVSEDFLDGSSGGSGIVLVDIVKVRPGGDGEGGGADDRGDGRNRGRDGKGY